ncbi:hypothetical protein [Streptomyces sp. NPDC049881]|uniref:hypothetical protein n=1 Tax=unclassified Streptomyces TaxID=2593676 RepID=UPI00344A2C07
MRLDEVVPHLARRPGMFGVDGAYATHVAFLHGFAAGGGGESMGRYRAFLVARLGTGGNLGWDGLVLRLAFPGDPARWDPRAARGEDEERAAVRTLLGTLEDFLREDAAGGR